MYTVSDGLSNEQAFQFNPGVGQITSTVGNPRQIQLALRVVF